MRLKLEFNSRCVVLAHRIEPRQLFRGSQLTQAATALLAAPMILAEGDQHRVPQCQFRLRDVPANEIGVLRRKTLLLQSSVRKEQPRTAIHQQPGRFRQGNALRVALMFTTGKETVITQQPPMAYDQVVIKQTLRTPAQLACRSDFEFQLDPREQRKLSAKLVQRH